MATRRFPNREALRAACEVGVFDRGEYQGKGIGLVDDKGRVAIPNALRAVLARNAPRADGKDGGSVVVGVHPSRPCLVAYDPGYVAIWKAKLDTREAAHEAKHGEPDYNIKARGASGEPVPFDGSGRFILPGFERHFANIREVAFFHGSFDWIEIWDPRTLIDTPGVDALLAAEAKFHCGEKGISL